MQNNFNNTSNDNPLELGRCKGAVVINLKLKNINNTILIKQKELNKIEKTQQDKIEKNKEDNIKLKQFHY